eukprot:2950408-Rhodomonas_salina.1
MVGQHSDLQHERTQARCSHTHHVTQTSQHVTYAGRRSYETRAARCMSGLAWSSKEERREGRCVAWRRGRERVEFRGEAGE